MTSTARIPLVLGNWKMHTSLAEAHELARMTGEAAARHPEVEVGLLPPYPWIVPLAEALGTEPAVRVGAQDIAAETAGAFTGDVAAEMLAPYVRFMLVGHSERRHGHGETDAEVRAKLDAVYRVDRIPVLAVGETEEERQAGRAVDVVTRQLAAALNDRPSAALETLVVAYEPVWAIGTGQAATPDDTSEMAGVVRSLLHQLDQAAAERTRILYGGSVKADNARAFFAVPDIDGGLVGGASLDARAFTGIIAAAGVDGG
ncbi:MAG TPA: triose-phosphate isomerase [Thermomicrobiales bacterium]|nr:triose-phosphate isomerase [Thermomicrobiales bacterium]